MAKIQTERVVIGHRHQVNRIKWSARHMNDARHWSPPQPQGMVVIRVHAEAEVSARLYRPEDFVSFLDDMLHRLERQAWFRFGAIDYDSVELEVEYRAKNWAHHCQASAYCWAPPVRVKF